MDASWNFLCLTIISSLSLFLWGMRFRSRICQYPFLMGFTFISFIIPQTIGIQVQPFPASEQGIERVFFMAFLCASMCWIGYQIKLPNSCFQARSKDSNMSLLRVGGFLYSCVGCLLWILVYSRPEAKGVGQDWTGIITIYVFFANTLNIGFTILLIDIFKSPKMYKFLLIFPALSMLLFRCFVAGRRSSIIFVVFGILCALYFSRRIAPSRKLILVGVILGTLAVTSTHEYRVISKSGNWSEISQINPIENLKSLTEKNGNKPLELKNAAVFIDSTIQLGDHQWGAGYWDKLVFRWVPAQILGKEFKQSLKLGSGITSRYDTLYELYGYRYHKGTTVTGIGDSFLQFDYFGCLIFAILAVLFKYLWVRALSGDLHSQIFYILILPNSFTALTHGTTDFLPNLTFYLIFLTPLIKVSQLPSPKQYLEG